VYVYGCIGNKIVKVVIRGDRETGKSALLRRLEGGPFIEQHIETPEIQSAHV
jgi:archaellum biogenesis ATPase FlaH